MLWPHLPSSIQEADISSLVKLKNTKLLIFFKLDRFQYVQIKVSRQTVPYNVKILLIFTTFKVNRAGMVDGVVGISSFLHQGPSSVQSFECLCDLIFRLSELCFPSLRGGQMSTSFCWELTCDGLASSPRGQ